jgi:NAD(P)-dependent dehydrogenase (short-subunit alcohol dehydrogenase family)
MPTWCIVGASRGIGFEFVRQLLDRGDQVIAAVRDPYKASELWQLAATRTVPGACQLCECDVTSEASINVSCLSSIMFAHRLTMQTFAARVLSLQTPKIDYLVLNAGVLKYPNVWLPHPRPT